MTEYGAALRQERKRRGMTLEDMAEYLGISSITIGLWERGKVRPNEDNQRLIREKLGIVPEVSMKRLII